MHPKDASPTIHLVFNNYTGGPIENYLYHHIKNPSVEMRLVQVLLNLRMECVWRRDHANHGEAQRDIADRIVGFYNCIRLHSKPGYLPPPAYEWKRAVIAPSQIRTSDIIHLRTDQGWLHLAAGLAPTGCVPSGPNTKPTPARTVPFRSQPV